MDWRLLKWPFVVQHDLMKLIVSSLDLVPKGWFSWDFTVLRDGALIAEIDISSWGEKGTLTVDGDQYAVYRDGFLGPFILDLNDTQVAVASKIAFYRSFTVGHQDKTYTLKAASGLGRTFVLLENDQEIGWIAPAGWFTRKATVDLPDQLPLPFRIFLLWLTVILWRRETAN